ncbi:MAG: class I SAM-dependent methyltransferase [Salegentibacter sp.]
MLQIIAYIKFLLQSQNQHGLHSPFVYDLVSECFYDKKKYTEYKTLKEFRKDLLRNEEEITVTDFGAGSRVFKSDRRKVKEIARHVGISEKRARFLFRLVNYLICRNVLELGTSLGIGTSALAANRSTMVTSIEGCPETARIARQQFQKFGLENIELRVGQFENVLEEIIGAENIPEEKWKVESGERIEKRQEKRDKRKETPNRKFDLVYFDGNHQKEATLSYFHQLLPAAHNDSVFIFDDIHWSPGMEEAWEVIKKHPSVKVSIDTFHLGLVFFRREQVKQHFKIRL